MTHTRWLMASVGFGIACGFAYAMSPLTVWLLLASTAILACMVRGMDPRERRIVLYVFGLALAVRVACLAVFFLASDHALIVSFPWDNDGLYIKWRAGIARDLWAGLPTGPEGVWEAFHRSYGWTSYINVLAYIQYLVGPSPYGVHAVSVAFTLATAAMLYRVLRRAFGSRAALFGAIPVLFMPTLIAWSVSALKESFYVFFGVTTMAAAVQVIRGRGILKRAAAVAVVVGAAAANGTVRSAGDVIVVGGLVAGFAAALMLPRPRVVAAAVIVVAVVGFFALRQPAVRARIDTGIQSAAALHIGFVKSGGNVYRLLDPRLYEARESTTSMTPGEELRFLIRAIPITLLVPLPWQVRSFVELVYLPQQIIWYVLLVLAVPGCIAGMKRDALVTGLLLGMVAVSIGIISVTNGNVGTTIRLRDTVVPFVAALSGLGVTTVLSWSARHLPATPPGIRRAWA